jgi:hypothetical protein
MEYRKLLTAGPASDSISRMKRRRFTRALATAPAVPALIAQETNAPPPPAPNAAATTGGGGRGGRGGGGTGPAAIEITSPDLVAEAAPRFFTAAQFNALVKLSDTLMPPMRGNPGALQCGAPEFLDFLIGVSQSDRKQLYRSGLDLLNARATAKFAKQFAELDDKQVDAVIRPLLVPVPWTLDPPKDPESADQLPQEWLAKGHRYV